MTVKNDAKAIDASDLGKRYFTLEEANRALPYVARITEDIRTAYRRAVAIQQRLELPMPDDDADELRHEYDNAVAQLRTYVDELQQVGVELKDYDHGLVDFPAIHDGRKVLLCWRRGEEAILAWHELESGFAGRRDISELNNN